jgi:hypothetical protein
VPEEDAKAARRLLRDEPPDLQDRVAIYVCPEDADLLCGALTAIVERQGAEIVWRAIANSQFDSVVDSWHHDDTSFSDWPDLRFDAKEYWRAITERPAAPTHLIQPLKNPKGAKRAVPLTQRRR